MDGLEEMLRLEKIGDPIERLVIDENRSQERLLRLDVVRCTTMGQRSGRRNFARGRVDGHDIPDF